MKNIFVLFTALFRCERTQQRKEDNMMKKRIGVFFLTGIVTLVMVSCFSVSAHAVPIGIDDFSGSETVETFSPGFSESTSPVIYNGLTYSSLGSGGSGTGIGVINFGAAYFSNILDASHGLTFFDRAYQSLIRIDFSMPVNRVGMLLSTGVQTTWTLTTYDDSLSILETTLAEMTGAANAVFVGLEDVQNIARIEISESFNNGNVSLLDDLRFEATVQSVPEPATVALLGIGLVGLAGAAVRRRLRQSPVSTLLASQAEG